MPEVETDSQITFTTRLTQQDWDASINAWRCPALAIPKAAIRDIFVDGNRIDKANYEVLQGPPMVRWIKDNPPPQIAAQIRISEGLSLESETGRWKKLAIVLPVVASIVVALIGAVGAYTTKTGHDDGPSIADLITARLSDWDVNKDRKIISYNIAVDPLDVSRYIKKSDKDKYRIIVGIRPRSATPHTDGEYDYAFGVYPFDSTPALLPQLDDSLRNTVASGCIDLIVFRVSVTGLATVPFKKPFIPAYYGPEAKVLASSYGGECP